MLRNLPCKNIQVDEIWSFVAVKEGNVRKAKTAREDAGDVWTWTAICADTKLLITTLNNVQGRGGKLKGTDVVCDTLSKDQIVACKGPGE